MSTNKRAHRRYAVEVAAEVELRGETVVASTENLSQGGVALTLDREVPEGASLSVTLFLTQDGIEDPDEEPFEAKASVVWCAERDDGGYAAGVRFSGVSAMQEKQLERFLAALAE